ncbi:MAG: molybdopterin molybdotransferase MoeA [Candidatus Omnitrophota bacterium]
MISVQEAEIAIAKSMPEPAAVECPLSSAHGAVLREDILADRDQPPFDRVMMDGVAIRFASWEKGRRQFTVAHVQKPGEAPVDLGPVTGCVEVMTGAVLPQGCDCVVKVEDLMSDGRTITLADNLSLAVRQNIHSRGCDKRRGELLLAKGTPLGPAQIAIAASVGKSRVWVSARPKIAVLATGDELVDAGYPAGPQQLRPSNSYAVAAALKLRGWTDVDGRCVRDDRGEIRCGIEELLRISDVLMITGGISMGKCDYVPEMIRDAGSEIIFQTVRQRPGKPFLFAMSKDNKAIFALPGNPVSAQVCLYRYALPALQAAMGAPAPVPEYAALAADFDTKTDFSFFLPVKIHSGSGGRIIAQANPFSCSGDLMSLAGADGFVELAADRRFFPAGYPAPFFRF